MFSRSILRSAVRAVAGVGVVAAVAAVAAVATVVACRGHHDGHGRRGCHGCMVAVAAFKYYASSHHHQATDQTPAPELPVLLTSPEVHYTR